MSIELPSDSFVALSAVAWADGRMSRDEAAGLIRAAGECGLSGDALDAVKKSTESKVDVDGFDPDALSPWQKALTYAIASWLARIDGVTSAEEHSSLVALGDRLGLAKDQLGAAASAAFDVSMIPGGGHKVDRYDFDELVAQLKVKLPSLAR